MSGMFHLCTSLLNLNLSNLSIQNVSHIHEMFFNCKSLKNLNLSNFNTQNVINMNEIFYGCKSLTKKNIITKDNKILKEIENYFN